MKAPHSLPDLPKSFEPNEAYEILQETSLILAPMLSGCTARRYQGVKDGEQQAILLCFGTEGPILPVLMLWPTRYVAVALGTFWYLHTLIDDGGRRGFNDGGLDESFRWTRVRQKQIRCCQNVSGGNT
jgi:hypothetical protein